MTDRARALLLRFRWQLLAVVIAFVLVWILFLDSHNIVQRIQWHQEHSQLVEENEALRNQIEELEQKLSEPLSDEMIERIAREEYSMRRAGESVYPIEAE